MENKLVRGPIGTTTWATDGQTAKTTCEDGRVIEAPD